MGADLFSVDVMRKASVSVPASQKSFHKRIFALFRALHWRIARKVAGGDIYAKYGVDEGLRVEDGNDRVEKIKKFHRKLHDEMLKNSYAPRDYVGYDSKKLHSNQKLVKELLV